MTAYVYLLILREPGLRAVHHALVFLFPFWQVSLLEQNCRHGKKSRSPFFSSSAMC